MTEGFMSHERDGGTCWCAETHKGWEGWTMVKLGDGSYAVPLPRSAITGHYKRGAA